MKQLLFLALTISVVVSDCQPCYDDLVADAQNTEDLVCGKDGITYINECFAECNDTEVEFEGRCPRNQCLDYWYPVCTSRGTYANECEARHYQATIISIGEC